MTPLTHDPILLSALHGENPEHAACIALELLSEMRLQFLRTATELDSARRVIALVLLLMPELPAAHGARLRDEMDRHAVIALACRRTET
jgi:hypothetical protein